MNHLLRLSLGAAIFALGLRSLALAEDHTLDRNVQGEAGKDIRVGVYINLQRDCRSGPLPTIRLSTAPAHGRVTVRKAKINVTNYQECLAIEVPAYAAFYKSQPGFTGKDVFVLEVKHSDGRTQVQRFTVAVTVRDEI